MARTDWLLWSVARSYFDYYVAATAGQWHALIGCIMAPQVVACLNLDFAADTAGQWHAPINCVMADTVGQWHGLIGYYGRHRRQWHALILILWPKSQATGTLYFGCYGRHHRPVAHILTNLYDRHRNPVALSDWLLWPKPQAVTCSHLDFVPDTGTAGQWHSLIDCIMADTAGSGILVF